MTFFSQELEKTDTLNGNESNTTAWNTGMKTNSEFPWERSSPALVLMTYDKRYSTYGAFRNQIIKLSNVIKSYGNGEFIGIDRQNTMNAISGIWNSYYGLCLLGFDSVYYAKKCIDSTDLRDIHMNGALDMYIIPTTKSIGSVVNYPYLQLDVAGKNEKQHKDYMNHVQNSVKGGNLCTGVTPVKILRGCRNPGYITITQWHNMDEYNNFIKACPQCIYGKSLICELEPGTLRP